MSNRPSIDIMSSEQRETMSKLMNGMTLNQLYALNGFVCSTIRETQRRESFVKALDFRIGEVVTFTCKKAPYYGATIKARILKINQKTVSCTEIDTGRRWNVDTALLVKESA